MKSLILIVTLFAICTSCFASTMKIENYDGHPDIALLIEKPLAPKVGAFAYAINSEYWSEAYIGFTHSPVPWCQLAIGQGIETGGNRTGGWIWVGKGRLSALYCAENGTGSGKWFKFEATYQLSPKLSVGYIDRSYRGRGATAEYHFDKNISVKLTCHTSGKSEVALVSYF